MTTQACPFRPESWFRSATNPLDAIALSTRARRSGPDGARFYWSDAKSSATFFNGEPFPQGYIFEQGQLFCSKNIERMGDHATNIAEIVHYIVQGSPLSDERPKADITSVGALPLSA